MKLITVKEYAEKEKIKLSTAYKRVKLGQAISVKRYGKTLVKDK